MMISGRILVAVLASCVLTILPLPPLISAIRPAWILLLVLYLQAYFPAYFHVFGVLFLGLCLDALLSTPMGEHAFALIITTWLMVGHVQRFRFFSIMQQMVVIALASCCYQFILFIADASFGHMSAWVHVFGVAITSMLCWPLLLRIQILRTERE